MNDNHINYVGTLKITNPKTIQRWKDKGWFQKELDKGYIFAEGCGRFRTEECNCRKCRKLKKKDGTNIH